MLYKFEEGHKVKKETKNINCAKDEGAVDHHTITRWLKNFIPTARTSTIRQDHVSLKQCSKP